MQANYTVFIDRVIKNYEGGYGWDKGDPGGPTKDGITCFDLAEHRHQKMTSMSAWASIVKAMPLSEAEAIYQDKYAAGLGFSILPSGADCCILDYGINSGLGRPIHVANAILRTKASKIDSSIVAAIEAYGVTKFINAMDQERLSFMHAIQGGRMWQKFGHGWGARVADLTAYSDHLATLDKDHVSTPPVAPDLSNVVTPKAIHVAKSAGGVTAGSVIAGPTSLHLAGMSHIIVAVAAVGILAAGIGYEAWQAHKTATANAKVVLPAGV